jgi:hypothetical protein
MTSTKIPKGNQAIIDRDILLFGEYFEDENGVRIDPLDVRLKLDKENKVIGYEVFGRGFIDLTHVKIDQAANPHTSPLQKFNNQRSMEEK